MTSLLAVPSLSFQGGGDSNSSQDIGQSTSCSMSLRVKTELQSPRTSVQSAGCLNDASGGTASAHPTRLLSALNERIGRLSSDATSASLDRPKQLGLSSQSGSRASGIEESEEVFTLESSTFGITEKSTVDDDIAYLNLEEDSDSYGYSSDMNYGTFSGDVNTFPPNLNSSFYAPIPDLDAPGLCFPGSSVRGGPVTTHTCPYCPYTTPSKQNMNRHQLWHTGERPFGCAYCSYRATTKQNALSHMRRRHADCNVSPDVVVCYQRKNSDR